MAIDKICDISDCTGCFACKNICPKNAINVNYDILGKTIPLVNDKCVECGLCINICPVNKPIELNYPLKCYAAKSNNAGDNNCSSGGVATVFSRYIVENGGYAYGAAFDREYMAAHKCIDRVEDLEQLKGSKYVQSYTGDTFKQVKEQLINNKNVIYIGTPCQIAGLKAYLNKDYDNLITVDLICHGTPPSTYLKEHINSLGISDYDNVTFRGKYDYMLSIYNENKILYQKSNDFDYYFASFYKGLTNRDNCYNCQYAQNKRVSDITIGDFWGLDENILKSQFNNKASVVLINTEKGNSFFENIKENIIFTERNIKEAINGNDQLRRPSEKHKLRDSFEKECVNGFSVAIKKVYKKQIIKNRILKMPLIFQLRQLRYNIKKRKIK